MKNHKSHFSRQKKSTKVEKTEHIRSAHNIMLDLAPAFDSQVIVEVKGREEETKRIFDLLLEWQNGTCKSIYLFGNQGSGKTFIMTKIINFINNQFSQNMSTAHINCRNIQSEETLYSEILFQLYHFRQRKAQTILNDLFICNSSPTYPLQCSKKKINSQREKTKLIVLDGIDLLISEELMYNLLEWVNNKNSKIILIFISNILTPFESLSPKIQSRMSLEELILKPYKFNALQEILNFYNQETEIFEPNCIKFICKKIESMGSDVGLLMKVYDSVITEWKYENNLEEKSNPKVFDKNTKKIRIEQVLKNRLFSKGSKCKYPRQIIKKYGTFIRVLHKASPNEQIFDRITNEIFLKTGKRPSRHQTFELLCGLHDMRLIEINENLQGDARYETFSIRIKNELHKLFEEYDELFDEEGFEVNADFNHSKIIAENPLDRANINNLSNKEDPTQNEINMFESFIIDLFNIFKDFNSQNYIPSEMEIKNLQNKLIGNTFIINGLSGSGKTSCVNWAVSEQYEVVLIWLDCNIHKNEEIIMETIKFGIVDHSNLIQKSLKSEKEKLFKNIKFEEYHESIIESNRKFVFVIEGSDNINETQSIVFYNLHLSVNGPMKDYLGLVFLSTSFLFHEQMERNLGKTFTAKTISLIYPEGEKIQEIYLKRLNILEEIFKDDKNEIKTNGNEFGEIEYKNKWINKIINVIKDESFGNFLNYYSNVINGQYIKHMQVTFLKLKLVKMETLEYAEFVEYFIYKMRSTINDASIYYQENSIKCNNFIIEENYQSICLFCEHELIAWYEMSGSHIQYKQCNRCVEKRDRIWSNLAIKRSHLSILEVVGSKNFWI